MATDFGPTFQKKFHQKVTNQYTATLVHYMRFFSERVSPSLSHCSIATVCSFSSVWNYRRLIFFAENKNEMGSICMCCVEMDVQTVRTVLVQVVCRRWVAVTVLYMSLTSRHAAMGGARPQSHVLPPGLCLVVGGAGPESHALPPGLCYGRCAASESCLAPGLCLAVGGAQPQSHVLPPGLCLAVGGVRPQGHVLPQGLAVHCMISTVSVGPLT